MNTRMIPPAPPPPPLVKTKADQSRDPPKPQYAAIPFTSDPPKPPVQETGHGPDQNTQPEEPPSSLLIEENVLQSPDGQVDNPPDVETILLPVQETSPTAEALNSQQNEKAVTED